MVADWSTVMSHLLANQHHIVWRCSRMEFDGTMSKRLWRIFLACLMRMLMTGILKT